MNDLGMINERNKLMVRLLWIFLVIDIAVNILAKDFLMVWDILILSLPVLALITFIVKKQIWIKSTMYLISLFFMGILFLLNFKSGDYVNLFFLVLPPIFSISYRDWKNIFFSTIGSAVLFSYFLLNEGVHYFIQWENTDLYYFILFFFCFAIFNMYETSISEKSRNKLSEEFHRVQRLQNNLYESEERYRSMVKQSLEGIFAFNPTDKTIVEANERFCKLLGYEEQELLNLTLSDIVVSDESIVDYNIANVLEKNRYFVGEKLYRRKDGSCIPVEVRASLIRFQNKSVILANIRDITEQKEYERTIKESEAKYRLIADNMSDFVSVLNRDRKIIYASPSHETVLDIEVSEFVGAYPHKYIHTDDLPYVYRAFEEMFEHKTCLQIEFRWKVGDDWQYIEMRGMPVIEENGEVLQVVVVSRNITDRVAIEEKIKQTSARLEALISFMPYGVLAEDKDAEVILINEKFREMFHITASNQDKFVSFGKEMFIQEDMYEEWCRKIRVEQISRLGEEWTLKDGRFISIDVIPTFINGQFDGYLWQFKDISEQKQLEHDLKAASLLDGLTKVSNRRYFDDRIKVEWEQSSKNSLPISLIMLDIDCFKNYNDTYGHLQGDECLKEIARTIEYKISNTSNVLCRYGGEEFAIIMPSTDKEEAKMFAEKIRATIEELRIPHIASIVETYVTCSLGVATVIPSMLFEPEELIRMADKALYKSKNSGRNCVSFYEKWKIPS